MRNSTAGFGLESQSKKPKPKPFIAKNYLKRIRGHLEGISFIALSPEDPTLLLTCSNDGILLQTSLSEKHVKQVNLCYPSDEMLAKFYLKDSAYARVPNLAEDHVLNHSRQLEKNMLKKRASAFFLHAEDMLMAVAYENGLVCTWDYRTETLLFPFLGHTNRVTCLRVYKQ